MSEERIVIAGGTGFIGRSFAAHALQCGHEVTILSRSGESRVDGCTVVPWDGRTCAAWRSSVDGADAIVNLVGRTVDCVKTPDHCDEILRSRVDATRVLGEAVRLADRPPRVWVQMATAHIYGDPPTARCTEASAFGYGLAPTVGRAWEEAFAEACPAAIRSVVLRTSFVIGRGGGALARLRLLARFGLGGTVSHGRQGMSWIHEQDMNRIIDAAISDASMSGAYLATAPNPVSNRVFMRSLRRAMRVPIGLPAFAWMVRIGAPLLLRTDPELALYGRYCIPQRLLDNGFEFEFDSIDDALVDLCRR